MRYSQQAYAVDQL